MMPIESEPKKKPSKDYLIEHLRTIGNKAIVLKKSENRGKFQPKGDEYILVGYSAESKVLRL